MKSSETLKKAFLFKELGDDHCEQIAQLAQEQHHGAGATIFHAGGQPDGLFFIGVGTVKMTGKSDDEDFGMMGTGAHFGELPFLDGQPHSLSVRTTEPTTVYKIPFDKLRALLDGDKDLAVAFYRAVSRFLSTRLRRVSQDLLFTREYYKEHH